MNQGYSQFSSVQFNSVTQSCPTLCDPMNCRMPGLPVHHQLPEFTQTHVHRVGNAIRPSHPVVPFSSCPQSLPASGSFPMSQLTNVVHANSFCHCCHFYFVDFSFLLWIVLICPSLFFYVWPFKFILNASSSIYSFF